MTPSERDILLAGLSGQEVYIPDLRPVFAGWPEDVNEHEPSIRVAMDQVLDSHASNPSISAKLKEENLALLTSSWWPYASSETLLNLTQFVGCIFTVDSLIDQASGPGKDKGQAFQDLHRSTDSFVDQKLDKSTKEKMSTSSNPAIDIFRVLNDLLAARYTFEQRKMFLDEARFTMEMLAVQQKFRINGRIPNLDEYRTYRQGSCCINAMIELVEYGNDLQIPTRVMQDPSMKILKEEAVRANWMTNDILSVKKELAAGFVENLVVLCASGACAQKGVDAAVGFLRAAVERFEAAAADLALHYASDEALTEDIAKFVNGCRSICMGSYTWSIVSKRYLLGEGKTGKNGDGDGGVVVVL